MLRVLKKNSFQKLNLALLSIFLAFFLSSFVFIITSLKTVNAQDEEDNSTEDNGTGGVTLDDISNVDPDNDTDKPEAGVITTSTFEKALCDVVDKSVNKQLFDCEVDSLVGICGGATKSVEKMIFGEKNKAQDYNCLYKKLQTSQENNDQEEALNITNTILSRVNGESGGLVGTVSAFNGKLLEQRPGSGIDFIGQKVYALSNPGKVNAQVTPGYYFPGTGYQLLKPIQSMWGWSVNIVYGLLIFIMVFVAFGVMFKGRLPGAASVTLQSAIPNIALAMILVPLSYAITGLFIDAVTVGTNVAHEFIIGPGSPARVVFDERMSNPNFTGSGTDRGLYADDYRMNLWNVHNYQSFGSAFSGLISSRTGNLIPPLVSDVFNTLTDQTGEDSWVAGIINMVIGGLLLLTSVRIFILLFQKFVVFMLYPVAAPFIFATIAIPGNGTNSITKYLKTLGAASLFYIVTYAMLLLVVVLESKAFADTLPDFGNANYIPPLLGFEGLGALESAGGGGAVTNPILRFVLAFVGIALYLNIPPYLQSIDAAWGTKLTIPKFFTQAYDSAKASINVARQARTTVGQAYGIPGRARTASNRLLQTGANIIDRARGIRPGERGSAAYNRAIAIQDDIANMETRRVQAYAEGNYLEARRLETNINMAKERLKGVKTSVEAGGGKLDDIKEGKFSAEVTWNGQGGPITLHEGVMKDLRAKAATTNTAVLAAGELALKTEGIVLSPMIVNKIAVYSVVDPAGVDRNGPRPKYFNKNVNPLSAYYLDPRVANSALFTQAGTDRSSDLRAGEMIVPYGKLLDAFANPAKYGFFVLDFPNTQLKFDEPALHPFGNGSSYKVGFTIVITDINAFLARVTPTAKPIKTPKYIFELQDYGVNALDNTNGQTNKTNPVDVKIMTDYAF